VEQFATLLVELHRSVASALKSEVPEEDHAIPFRTWLMDVLEAVDQPLRTKNSHAQVAYDLIRTEKPQILALLAHVEEIALGLQASDHEVAVTHGDLASHNIIQDEHGRLFLIDWGKLRVAPAVRDLVTLWEEAGAPLLSAYFRAAGDAPVCSNNIAAYYLYHNLLATITDYGSWLVLEHASEEEAENAWKHLRQALPIDLAKIQAKIEAISTLTLNTYALYGNDEQSHET
jgi:thiamine kinase-like enzyme